ncbi:cellobiose dehydrogenase [Fusarium longipes]|uniref:Cellobiose dehydrogenase n=1 Tax=Fusarium longipes TaxID=694270 RepID=A0A395SPC2_9HYPO|nr:cellobiose dehydrogenase [Fusarium longipes]
MKWSTSSLLAALCAPSALAITPEFCPRNGKLCFTWGVPEASASSGSGPIYFQLKAPTSMQWAGLGIGSQMAGSQMFIMYQDGKGNVTLSPRPGKGEVMPQYSKMDGLELLEGSGVKNNEMIANVRCSNCKNLDLKGSDLWIAAWLSGDSLDSTSPSERISQHDGHATFDVNLAKASMSSDSNPFLSANTNNGNSGSGGAVAETANSGGASETVQLAHGIIMSIVFIAGYPLGAILMPILGKWLIHAGWQVVMLLLMWAGFGLGYVCARDGGVWGKQAHTRMGTAVCALITLQPILGYMHHRHFLSHGKRGIISHIHIWFGRALMIIGIVNGGLGLQLASSSRAFIIAYSVIAGLAAVLYLGAAVVGERRRSASHVKQISPQMSQEEAR